MDHHGAYELLQDYWQKVQEASSLPRFEGKRKAALSELNRMLPRVNRLLRELAPDIPAIKAEWINDHYMAASMPIHRATAVLLDAIDMDGQKEDPALPLRLLDPAVASVAEELWKPGKYRQAVNDAATALNEYAQDRLGVHDISDIKLMTEAFSADPPTADRPRLRCPGDHRRIEIKDQQNGARQLAAGALLAIRNPAHHMTGDWNPVTAFHHLVILSQVASYFRNWKVQRYVPPPPDPEVLAAAMMAMQKRSQAALGTR